jgi:hypothetical protein
MTSTPRREEKQMPFHQYDISELYSNANGAIQFIELTGCA